MQHPSPGLPSQDQVAFDHALSRVIEGMADERDMHLVRESLRSNAGLRKRYLDQMLLDADLVEEFSTESISGMIDVLSMGVQAEAEMSPPASRMVRASETARARTTASRRDRRWAGAGLLFVFALLIALAGWNASQGVVPTPKSVPLATVSRVRYLVVRPGEPIPIAGRALSSGRVALESGVVEITVRNGVELVLEGPGEMELLGDSHAILRSGNLVARMGGPPGRHFQLDTPTIRLQANDAEFAVRASPGFVVDVQAYRGDLVVTRPGGMGEAFPRKVTPSQAARFRPVLAAEAESIPFDEERFVRRIPSSDLPDPNPAGVSMDEGAGAWFDSLTVTRRTTPVRIDGRIEDWSESVGFLGGRDSDGGELRAVGRMMYDEHHLFVAAQVRDPAPMRNVLSPSLDADSAWRGGAVQLWISADRRAPWPVNANSPGYFAARRVEPSENDRLAARNQRLSQLTLWHHAPDGKACLAVSHGMLGVEPTVNPEGFQGAFAKDADGGGYVLEYAIPWSLLNAGADPPKPGDNLAVGWMFRWSDESGRLARDRLPEIRNGDEPASVRFSDRAATWGVAKYR